MPKKSSSEKSEKAEKPAATKQPTTLKEEDLNQANGGFNVFGVVKDVIGESIKDTQEQVEYFKKKLS